MNHPFRRDHVFAAALRNRLSHPIDGMFAEQLQHPDVLTRAGEAAMPHFEVFAQPSEVRG